MESSRVKRDNQVLLTKRVLLELLRRREKAIKITSVFSALQGSDHRRILQVIFVLMGLGFATLISPKSIIFTGAIVLLQKFQKFITKKLEEPNNGEEIEGMSTTQELDELQAEPNPAVLRSLQKLSSFAESLVCEILVSSSQLISQKHQSQRGLNHD